jgi:hypothetical protein
VKKTLKEQLQDTLKKLKIKTSNEEGLERATLQYDELLLAHNLLCNWSMP